MITDATDNMSAHLHSFLQSDGCHSCMPPAQGLLSGPCSQPRAEEAWSALPAPQK